MTLRLPRSESDSCDMPRLPEERGVQDALVNHLIGIGWDYLLSDEIMRSIDPRRGTRWRCRCCLSLCSSS